MERVMPQDIEVRYILPAVRKELARILIQEHNLSQKEASNVLGLTEAAVSQYQHYKRAKDVVFEDSVIQEIKKSAERLLANRKNKHSLIAEMYRISNLATVKHLLCNIHRANSKELEKCNVCFNK